MRKQVKLKWSYLLILSLFCSFFWARGEKGLAAPLVDQVTWVNAVGISPNGDGVCETLGLSLNLNQPARLLWRISDAAGMLRFQRERNYPAGAVAIDWDGKDNTGRLVPDGTYTARLLVQSQTSAATWEEEKTFQVDTTPPRPPELLLPLDAATVTQMPPVLVWRADPDVAYWEVRWGETLPLPSQGEIISSPSFVLPKAVGYCYWQVVAYDQFGNASVSPRWSFRGGDLPAQFNLINFQVGPNPFSPNGDGQADSLYLSFALAAPAVFTAQVVSLNGTVVWEETQTVAAGDQTVRWDGRNRAGQRVSPGLYLVHVVAYSPAYPRKPARAEALVGVIE